MALALALAEEGGLPTGLLYRREGRRRSRSREQGRKGGAEGEAAGERCGLWPEELRLEEGVFEELVSRVCK